MTINNLVWLTDIHLNFLDIEARKLFYQNISETKADGVLITGDIGEANSINNLLLEMSTYIGKPVYFVLGNHDYYSGSIVNVRESILDLCKQNKQLFWLGKPEIIELNDHSILVGHDGWADARYGDYDHSPVNLNDSRLIAELYQARLLNKTELQKEMQKFADADANALSQILHDAIKPTVKRVIIATHGPPFAECCWHMDMPSDENWLPYFASKATGDVIANVAQLYSSIDFLVLCGHTHTEKTIKLYNNLTVRAGRAQYYYPEIQGLIYP